MVRLGFGVLLSLLAAKALAYWLGFAQLAERSLGDAAGLGSAFLVAVAKSLAVEGGILVVSGLIVAQLLATLGFTTSPRRLFAILLVASTPLLIYALAVVAALASGWQMEAWVL